jgi:large subunit ribosomal protein L6
MSRIGRKPITVPKNVKVSISGRTVTVEGPKGTLKMEHRPDVQVAWEESEKSISVGVDEAMAADDRKLRAYWGTTRALISNMIEGVTNGYEKKLEIVGVGWSGTLQGQNLSLKVGYANRIEVPIPTGLKVTVEKQLVTINGADKQMVGHFAAKVRSKRKPEPYNGKGIKYSDEVIQRKQGKAFGK